MTRSRAGFARDRSSHDEIILTARDLKVLRILVGGSRLAASVASLQMMAALRHPLEQQQLSFFKQM